MAITLDPAVPVHLEFPGKQTPLEAVTQTADSWDSAAGAKYVTLTTDACRVEVSLDKDAFLNFTDTTAAPSNDGALYLKGVRYEFKLRGMKYLHVKNGAAGQNATAYVSCWTA
jgi:hypothetical protein